MQKRNLKVFITWCKFSFLTGGWGEDVKSLPWVKALPNKEDIYSILCPHCKTSGWEGNQSNYLLRIPSSSPVIDRSCVYPRPSSSNRIGFVAQDLCLLVFFPTFISAISPLKKTNINLNYTELKSQLRLNTFLVKTPIQQLEILCTYPSFWVSPFLWDSVIDSCCLSFLSSSDSTWLLFGRVEAAADAAVTSSGSSVLL